MPASRQPGYDGSESKRAWATPIVAALPIRATASSWGFKWDSGWGGGKRDSVGHRPPNQQIEAAPIRQTGARLARTPDQRGWESPVVKALPVRATAAGWGTKFDTYMALERSGSIGHLAPRLPAQNAAAPGTRARLSGKPDRRGWEAPTVKALSLRDTASSWGIKWDLYMGGGKMATGPQSPPQHQPPVTSTGGMVARTLRGSGQRSWEAPTVTALSFRFTAITVD